MLLAWVYWKTFDPEWSIQQPTHRTTKVMLLFLREIGGEFPYCEYINKTSKRRRK
jgi:hypothetical protein